MAKINNKIFIFISIFFLFIFSFENVFAYTDEDLDNICDICNNDLENCLCNEVTDESDVDTDNTDNPIVVEYSNKEDLDNISRDISSIKSSVRSLLTTPNYPSGGNGILTTFDKLSTQQLDYYYQHYLDYDFWWTAENKLFFLDSTYYVNSYINALSWRCVEYSRYDWVNYYGVLEHADNNYTFQYYNYNSDNAGSGYFKTHEYLDIPYYLLVPCKLTVDNSNSLGNFTFNNLSSPYINSSIFYENQIISLTYDNSYNDFVGWYDINGNLLSEELTLNYKITEDTTIIVNYPNPSTDVDSDLEAIIISIFVLLLFIVFKSLIWGV